MRTRLKVRKQPDAEALSSKLIFVMRIPGSVIVAALDENFHFFSLVLWFAMVADN
jgi:hypothetical protein